jgi:hypothetical protein
MTQTATKNGATMNIALETLLAKLPIEQINETVHKHIEPLLRLMPEKRMGRVAELIILGILGGQTPVITEGHAKDPKAKVKPGQLPNAFIAGSITRV